jgi:GTP-binding protein
LRPIPLLKIRSLRLACATLDPSRFPKSPRAEVAVSGRSNVGKSSLLNVLFERRNLARISKDPGKTRSINFYTVNDRFLLVDLPGYGYAKVSIDLRNAWMRTVHSYIEKRDTLTGVVQLIDARHPPSTDDLSMIARLIESGRPFIVVFTKADKVTRAERRRVVDAFRARFADISVFVRSLDTQSSKETKRRASHTVDVEALFFSARTGEGKEKLWSWILERIEDVGERRDE